MLGLACLLLVPGQIDLVPSSAFSKELQQRAVAATVRIRNVSQDADGSGVVLGAKGAFVYILTAHHVVSRNDRFEVATFSPTSYPRPHRVYRTGQVVAEAEGVRDLALIRLTTNDRLSSLSLCPSRLVPAGTAFSALTVGCPEGKAPSSLLSEVTGKKLVRRNTEGKASSCWEVDRKDQEGRSGGPLIDPKGYLLGVCSGTNREKTYFCHIEEIRGFLKHAGIDWLP